MIFSLLRHRVVPVFIAFTAFAAVAAIGLSGCAQAPERPRAEPVSTTADREKLVQRLQDSGELAEALVQWKILATIEPANVHYQQQIAATKHLIDSKSKSHTFDGITNLRRGEREAARLSFLKALALNPKNKEAFEYLRQLSM